MKKTKCSQTAITTKKLNIVAEQSPERAEVMRSTSSESGGGCADGSRRTSMIEVFDFNNHWNRVLPYLNDRGLNAILAQGVNDYIRQCVEDGCKHCEECPRGGFPKFDPNKGPWYYSFGPHWQNVIAGEGIEAVIRGEFKVNPKAETDDNEMRSELARMAKFGERFHPKKDTYKWYQMFGGCHWLAPWLKALGKRIYPKLHWKLMRGEAHSLAYGADKEGSIKVIFDILNFDHLTGAQLIEFATQKGAGPCPACAADGGAQ